jgi:hypothetical protein
VTFAGANAAIDRDSENTKPHMMHGGDAGPSAFQL